MHNITPVAVSIKNVMGHFHQRHSAKREVKCTQTPQVALVTMVPSESESLGKINDVVSRLPPQLPLQIPAQKVIAHVRKQFLVGKRTGKIQLRKNSSKVFARFRKLLLSSKASSKSFSGLKLFACLGKKYDAKASCGRAGRK